MNIGGSLTGALFTADDHRYRVALWRLWDFKAPALFFIGLNPSTANEIKDDPTIRRLAGFARSWGYGGLYAGNLFSLVTPDPAELFVKGDEKESGELNNEAIRLMRKLAALTLLGWGRYGAYALNRPKEVLAIVGEPVYCLAVNQNGEPVHPLYQPASSRPRLYERREP